MRISHFGYFGLALSLTVAGCGGPAHQFAEVQGKLTFENVPLAGALVRFYPVSTEKEQPPYATGITDEAGIFTLKHGKAQPGALVGPNRVVVSWPSRDIKEYEETLRGKPFPPPTVDIPLKYTVASETPLLVEVKPSEPQTIDIALKDIE